MSSPLFASGGEPAEFVNPFIGTDAHGHTYPGATVPFGMVQVSPDNGKRGWDWCSGYHYSCDTIVGFSHTHLSGTGCADLGDILITPCAQPPDFSKLITQTFSHANETASPGFYSVKLNNGTLVELTATERAAMHRYTFPRGGSAFVVIDLGYGQDDSPQETLVRQIGESGIEGHRFSSGWAPKQEVFFSAEFSRPFKAATFVRDDSIPGMTGIAQGKRTKAILEFASDDAEPLMIRVGISATSNEGARANLLAEIPHWDFEKLKSEAHERWNEALGRVRVEMMSDADRTTFYTALYHAFLAPTLFNDVDKTYRGGDGNTHQGEFHNYCTFSLWDTYRAAHPLYTILQPERVNDFVNSMLAFHDQHGNLPVWSLAGDETWCMIGYHSVPVIADAGKKGFRGFDIARAFDAITASAGELRRGLEFYNQVKPTSVQEKMVELCRNEIVPPNELRESALGGNSFVIPGFAKTVSGERIHYHSHYPYVKDALIARATDGTMCIEWETDYVPGDLDADTVTFMWVAGHCAHWGSHRFDLFVNDEKWLSFHTSPDSSRTSWQEVSSNGAKLTFLPLWRDVHQDHFGEMYLTVPATLLDKDRPLRLKVTGENAGSNDWYMTFEHVPQDTIAFVQEYALSEENGRHYQFGRIYLESMTARRQATVEVLGEQTSTVDIRPGLNQIVFSIPAVSSVKTGPLRVYSESFERHLACELRPIQPLRYIPADKVHESVSKTLEYAYDDWCIAEMARELGKTEDTEYFAERATNWKSLFDSATGFMRGRNFDGSWVEPFNPRFGTGKQPEYTEGNAWQYSWYVPHDVEGLITAHGGNKKFALKLDSLFEQDSNLEEAGATADMTGLIGLYAHGNEPSHHIAYLYDFCRQPGKAQKLVRRIMREFYTEENDGLCGNEDCGQMSAWYIFSALGFYPVNPANGVYMFGSPLVKRAAIDIGGGRTFTVIAEHQSEANVYVTSISLNGEPLSRLYITHEEIMRGGELKFVMGPSAAMR